MNHSKKLLSIGAALAARPFARSISSFDMADALALVGLERRRSRTWERVALIGAGAAVGAGAALLLAPASGRDTRKRIKQRAVELAEEAEQMGERAIGAAEEAMAQGVAHGNNGNNSGESIATHHASQPGH